MGKTGVGALFTSREHGNLVENRVRVGSPTSPHWRKVGINIGKSTRTDKVTFQIPRASLVGEC
jgi:hypothetical protein